MKFEDTILSYLDGSLDEHSRAELLHTLSVSPEKRALLEEHLRLRELMAFGHKPLNVPIAAERALAERIGVLATALPKVGEEVSSIAGATGFMAGAARVFSSLFGSAMLRTTVGLLAAGASIWYVSARHSDPSARPDLALSRSSTIASNSTLAIPTTPMAGGSSVSIDGVSATPPQAEPRVNEHSGRRDSPNGVSYYRGAGFASRSATKRSSGPNSSTRYAMNATSESELSATNGPSSDVDASSAVSVNPSKDAIHSPHSNEVSAASQRPGAALNDLAALASLAHELASMTHTAGHLGAERTALDRNEHMPITYYQDDESRSASGRLSVWIGYGLTNAFTPTLANSNSVQSLIQGISEFGAEYRVLQGLSIGIDAGRSNFSRIVPAVSALPIADQPGLYRVSYASQVAQSGTFWSRATLSLGLLSEGFFHAGLGAGAGLAFSDQPSPTFEAAVVAGYDLTDRVSLTGKIQYSGAWLAPQAAENWRNLVPTGSQTVGILTDGATKSTLFTPAFDLLVGLRYAF